MFDNWILRDEPEFAYTAGLVRITVNDIDVLINEFEDVNNLLKKGNKSLGISDVKLDIIESSEADGVHYCTLSFCYEPDDDFIDPLNSDRNEEHNKELAQDIARAFIDSTIPQYSVIYYEPAIDFEYD